MNHTRMPLDKTASDDPTKAILSIQSEVAYGHVGNSAAVLPLQRLGFEVWPVNTVQLGHHPGHGSFRGYCVEMERLSAILNAVLDQAPLERCVGMIVGYLGDAGIAGPVLQALDAVIAKRPDLVFLLDPVIGDDGAGVFVRPGVPAAIADELLPRAAIITPNRFELAHFSGLEVDDLRQAELAAERLLKHGPRLVVATGLLSPGWPGELLMLAVSSEERWLIRTPRLARTFSGTGDAFSALFLGHFLLAPDLKTAFERVTSAIFSLAEMTAVRGEDELALVAAQDVLAAPAVRFHAVQP
ncbi:MAG: pyridoxal kinase [Geminicoccaceae bacterium]